MFKEGSTKNNQAVIRVAFFAGSILFFLLIFGLTKELVNRRQIDRQLADYQKRIDQLRIENSSLSERISSWSDSGELEASARIKLGLEKPGEKTVIIDRQSNNDNLAMKSSQEVVNLDPKSEFAKYEDNPSKWWKYFFQNNINDN